MPTPLIQKPIPQKRPLFKEMSLKKKIIVIVASVFVVSMVVGLGWMFSGDYLFQEFGYGLVVMIYIIGIIIGLILLKTVYYYDEETDTGRKGYGWFNPVVKIFVGAIFFPLHILLFLYQNFHHSFYIFS